MIIGLDVGGTHTDVVLLDNKGLLKAIKVTTNASDLFSTVLEGLNKIKQGINPDKISRIVFSTTLTTNAIVQDNLSDVGIIVSAGPGVDPEFFRIGSFYYPVSGCIDHRGREIESVDPYEIEKISDDLFKKGIKTISIIAKFSVRNPAHELFIKKCLKNRFEKVFLGHRISGHLNFPRRIATTYLNAAVYPLHKSFFIAVKKSLEREGLKVPIHIMKADGGTMNFGASMDFPGQTIFSGPAASVMGSLAAASEDKEILVLDIGGTTTDIAILISRVPILDPLGIRLGPYRTLIRSLKVHSIGIGGDSAVKVIDGKLKIGPERLGPSMAYGGSVPTPTDALCVLGIIKNIDPKNSIRGIRDIALMIGASEKQTALDILDYTTKKILKEAWKLIKRINSKPVYTVHELKEGYRITPQEVLILGGPAPYFSRMIEKMSGLPTKVVPKWHVANAIGAALARTTCEVTLFADTELGRITAPEENFTERISENFSKNAAVIHACDLLKRKALLRGAREDDLAMETVEEIEFNMIRGFYTTGKNIRVKVQVQPGLISEYKSISSFFRDEQIQDES